MAWLLSYCYFLFVLLLGRLFVRSFRPSPGRLLGDWSSAFLAGQLILTTLTLFTAFLPVSLRTMVVPLGILAIAGEAFRLRNREGAANLGRVLAGAALFLVLTLVVFPRLAVWHHGLPLLEWDARTFWFFKGKAVYLAGRIETEFFTSSRFAWTHQDYPLHLPVQAAWNSLFLGEWSEYWAKYFLLFNLAAYFRLAFLLLKERGYPGWLSLFLAGAFLSQETLPYLSGNADNHYIVTLVLSGLALILPAGKGKFYIFVLLLSCAAATKLEGTVYGLMLGAVALIWWSVWRFGKRARPEGGSARRIVWVLLLFALPLALWSLFKWLHSIEGNLHLEKQVPEFAARLGDRWESIADSFLYSFDRLNSLVVIGAIGVLFLADLAVRRRFRVGRAEILTAIAFLAVNVLIFVTYVLTPEKIHWHLATSAGRLLLLPHLLLSLWVLFRLDRFVLPASDRSETAPVRERQCGS